MTQHDTTGGKEPRFIDVQRREISVRTVSTADGVETLAIEKLMPGEEPKRLMLLNKFDAQQLKDTLDEYLKTIYSKELAGLNTTLSPKDMVELFGEDEN
ncbi:hypothetical protein ACG98H_09490 [Corynebacterium sp. L4756]|uniref:hypothetical protein n=1 Tax=unclassified Corynebacterium TaxID=2624378 RepID=UPI00374D1D41